MSPHYFHSVVDHVSESVLGSPVLIYIDDCCGHKIVDASFDVIEELLAAVFKSLKFVIEACCEPKITYKSFGTTCFQGKFILERHERKYVTILTIQRDYEMIQHIASFTNKFYDMIEDSDLSPSTVWRVADGAFYEGEFKDDEFEGRKWELPMSLSRQWRRDYR